MFINNLKYNKTGNDYETGYRIVYLYKDRYSIGAYCKTIGGFMIGFATCDQLLMKMIFLNLFLLKIY